MSNVIPYLCIGCRGISCYLLRQFFSRGDGESQSKPKTHGNSHVDNNLEAKNDSPTATESKHGDVTITHAVVLMYILKAIDSSEGQSGEVLL